MGEKTFIKITNADIYHKILDLEENTRVQHSELLAHQQYTNGKVKLNRWIATTALAFVVIIIGSGCIL